MKIGIHAYSRDGGWSWQRLNVGTAARSGVLAVGPRDLPSSGTVLVWVDAGSTNGQKITVPVERLRLSEQDKGEGRAALHELETYSGRG